MKCNESLKISIKEVVKECHTLMSILEASLKNHNFVHYFFKSFMTNLLLTLIICCKTKINIYQLYTDFKFEYKINITN